MSYSSTGTSSSHNNGMEREVAGSGPTRCVCNLPITKEKIMNTSIYMFILHGKEGEYSVTSFTISYRFMETNSRHSDRNE